MRDLQTELVMLEALFPKGGVIYHKATGQAFVVLGYRLDDQDNELRLRCDPGSGLPLLLPPLSMTTEKPTTTSDDE